MVGLAHDTKFPHADVWDGVRIYRDIAYGPRGDAPGEGKACKSPMTGRHSGGYVFNSHRSGQFFDLIISDKTEVRADTPVYVNLHGGAWCQPFDKDGESFHYFRMLVERGFIVVNANYQLQNDVTDKARPPQRRENAAFLDMLRDIDVLGSFLKTNCLPRLGVKVSKFVIGGSSAGAHLSLLYAYDQDNPALLNAGLRHDFRVGVVVDIVGPVNLAHEDFLADYRFVKLFGWLVDDDLPARLACGDRGGVRKALERYSPIRLVTSRSVPTILAYCQLFPFAKSDGIIPVCDYHELCAKLKAEGVPHIGNIRSFRSHGNLGLDYMCWIADRVSDFHKRGYLAD